MFHDYTKPELAWVVIKSVIIVILKYVSYCVLSLLKQNQNYTIYNCTTESNKFNLNN